MLFEALGETWRDLWAFAERHATGTVDRTNTGLDPVGLLLERDVVRWTYDSTPLNSHTFASTGGDGVHFGVLDIGDERSVVVMTVPMNWDRANLIVGADLIDFLRLGHHCGYFALEQLSYAGFDWPGVHEAIDHGTDLLHSLRDEFELTPHPDPAAHLADLHGRFGHRIELARDT